MLQDYLWFIYALTAAILWGIHYATAGELAKTMSPFLITVAYLVFVSVTILGMIVIFQPPTLELKLLSSYLNKTTIFRLGLMVLTGGLSNFLVFSAIADSSATKASIIEITYPFFVALFATFLYRENALNLQTAIGGLLILFGVVIVLKS